MSTDKAVPAKKFSFTALDRLECGQSTEFPVGVYFSLCSALRFRQTRYGKKFTRRTEGAIVRVWRVE